MNVFVFSLMQKFWIMLLSAPCRYESDMIVHLSRDDEMIFIGRERLRFGTNPSFSSPDEVTILYRACLVSVTTRGYRFSGPVNKY
jgi:hypothetical protein